LTVPLLAALGAAMRQKSHLIKTILGEVLCMNRRWFIYIVVGILFGVFDFYYPNFIPQFDIDSRFWGEIVGFALDFGIWLVPIVPIVLYEARVSRSRVLPALASSLAWCISVIVYYLTNVVQLAIGSPMQPDLRISNHNNPFFWVNWGNLLVTYILGHILEWAVVAVVGGIIIGFLVSFIYLLFFGISQNFE
jgi:hypothetical protein